MFALLGAVSKGWALFSVITEEDGDEFLPFGESTHRLPCLDSCGKTDPADMYYKCRVEPFDGYGDTDTCSPSYEVIQKLS